MKKVVKNVFKNFTKNVIVLSKIESKKIKGGTSDTDLPESGITNTDLLDI